MLSIAFQGFLGASRGFWAGVPQGLAGPGCSCCWCHCAHHRGWLRLRKGSEVLRFLALRVQRLSSRLSPTDLYFAISPFSRPQFPPMHTPSEHWPWEGAEDHPLLSAPWLGFHIQRALREGSQSRGMIYYKIGYFKLKCRCCMRDGLQLLRVKRGMNELLCTSYLLRWSHFRALVPVPPCFFFGEDAFWLQACSVQLPDCVSMGLVSWLLLEPSSGCRWTGTLPGKLRLDRRKSFSVVRLVKCYVAQRGCGISIPGGIQDSAGHGPEHPGLGAVGQGLD